MDQNARPVTQLPSPENMATREYCKTCEYPLEDDGTCYVCTENKRKSAAYEREKRQSEILRLGGLRAYETYKLDLFKPKSEAQNVALEACRSFDPKADNLMLIGPAGTGKTHLAVGAARKFHGVVWKPMEIARKVRAQEGAEKESKVIGNLIECPAIVIDDLGVEKPTEWLTVLLFEIVDGRYQSMRGGLIITANVGLDGLAQRLGDDRISSRLAQMCKRFSFAGVDDARIKA